MAVTQHISRHIGIIYSPLTMSPGITVEGNVEDRQQYDIAANVYTPDYTMTYLVLRPHMLVSDPDGVIADGEATLTNMRWTLLENKTATVITASTAGFGVGADGKLTVMRNCAGQNPMTLRFEADYVDPRTGNVYHMMEDHAVICEGVAHRPVLTLDTSGVVNYDPVRDGEMTRKVKAMLTVGGKPVVALNREFVWQKRDSDGVWANIDGSDAMDYDVSLSADKTELAIKLWLIGERIDIRCYAKYNPYGSPSAMGIDTRTPVEGFSAVRVNRRLRGSVISPQRLKAGVKEVRPKLVVTDSKGVIPDPDKVLDIEWRTSTGVASGAVSNSAVVARGSRPTIPTTFVAKRFGGQLLPYFGVKDPLGALTDGSGAVLVDGSGAVLIG